MRNRGASPEIIILATELSKMSDSSIDKLFAWESEFRQLCKVRSNRFRKLNKIKNDLKIINKRTYLELTTQEQQIENSTKEIFTKWLGSPEISSTLRERLFFALEPESDNFKVTLDSYIGQPKKFDSAEEATKEIVQLFKVLTRSMPSNRISKGLMLIEDNLRSELAKNLVDTNSSAHKSLLVIQNASDLSENEAEAKCLEDFVNRIPKPAKQGDMIRVDSQDNSAIYRLELLSLMRKDYVENLPFISINEKTAEKVRKCIEGKYQKRIPPLPPELRIALGRIEKFKEFAQKYKNGQILSTKDAEGRDQWIFTESSERLTFENNSSLAHAAAKFVCLEKEILSSTSETSKSGDFQPIEDWKNGGDRLNDNIITLLAIVVIETCL